MNEAQTQRTGDRWSEERRWTSGSEHALTLFAAPAVDMPLAPPLAPLLGGGFEEWRSEGACGKRLEPNQQPGYVSRGLDALGAGGGGG